MLGITKMLFFENDDMLVVSLHR